TNPDTSPVETDAINKRRLNQRTVDQRVLNQRVLPIPAFPSVTTGCFDLRRSVERSVIGSRARASHKRSGNIRTRLPDEIGNFSRSLKTAAHFSGSCSSGAIT